jgi:hypothetical protein
MARARVSHTRGQGFDSLLAHLLLADRGRTGSESIVRDHGLLWWLILLPIREAEEQQHTHGTTEMVEKNRQ